MTPKEHQAFAAELHRMSAFEVRENTTTDVQPDPLKRAMAVTELEKRRQARAPDTIRGPVNATALFLALAFVVAGAFVWWKFF
jgi:hypothetical protein